MANTQTFTAPCVLIGLVAVLLLTGCRSGIPEPIVDLPLRQASAEELVTLLNQRSGGIHSLRALLQLQARDEANQHARLRTVASPVWFRPSPLEPKSQASLLYAILITRTDIE